MISFEELRRLFDAHGLGKKFEYVKQMESGCWEWTGAKTKDYGYGVLHADRAHRVTYEMAHGSATGLVIRHRCDNPPCCNPNHLAAGTHADNVRDRVSRGRSAAREANGRSKLTTPDAAMIRADRTHSVTQLARAFGVDRKVIRDIKNGVTWKGVEPAPGLVPSASQPHASPTLRGASRNIPTSDDGAGPVGVDHQPYRPAETATQPRRLTREKNCADCASPTVRLWRGRK